MSGRTVTLEAVDLDGYLTSPDNAAIANIDRMYSGHLALCSRYERGAADAAELGQSAAAVGSALEEICAKEPGIHVYSFETPREQHPEASRLIARLRDPATSHEEFVYYIQRAYELLFGHCFNDRALSMKRDIVMKTPVTVPSQNWAVHRIPDIDPLIRDTVMCVMLRGALLPSMIISKEIQDYSSDGRITPFALFKIKRDETRSEGDMRYVLDLDKSFFDLSKLDGRDLVFADPMNATGGSLVTIMNFLAREGVKPRSVKFINVISALKGALRVVRAVPGAEVHTLWMDPSLNEHAYIMPGLGDAGDRLNGVDGDEPRNIIQLIADYGSSIVNLYRDQVREIEKTVLG